MLIIRLTKWLEEENYCLEITGKIISPYINYLNKYLYRKVADGPDSIKSHL